MSLQALIWQMHSEEIKYADCLQLPLRKCSHMPMHTQFGHASARMHAHHTLCPTHILHPTSTCPSKRQLDPPSFFQASATRPPLATRNIPSTHSQACAIMRGPSHVCAQAARAGQAGGQGGQAAGEGPGGKVPVEGQPHRPHQPLRLLGPPPSRLRDSKRGGHTGREGGRERSGKQRMGRKAIVLLHGPGCKPDQVEPPRTRAHSAVTSMHAHTYMRACAHASVTCSSQKPSHVQALLQGCLRIWDDTHAHGDARRGPHTMVMKPSSRGLAVSSSTHCSPKAR